MKLSEIEFLFIDCQTTGMRPPQGELLELAWSRARADQIQTSSLHSALLSLRAGETIPARVSEITGITDSDLTGARQPLEVLQELWATLTASSADKPSEPLKIAVIHYAQFELPFLNDLFARWGSGDLPQIFPLEVLCSHRLCKKLLPNLPSSNIRGAAGFFGSPLGGIQRAGTHVRATQVIWQGLVAELSKLGVEDLAQLRAWQRDAVKIKQTRYEYPLDRLKRLELPDVPGVYRMISKTGEVLYVGKATSLKSRVNSYFRGQKNRDRFKLEMLAQVWDLRVTPCRSPLEAALLESDEIKHHNPRYNIVLKRGTRHLLFYSHDFSQSSRQQSHEFANGPFRNSNWIESLRLVEQSLKQTEFLQIFYIPIDPSDLRAGFELFLNNNNLSTADLRTPRSMLALGMWLLKNHREPEEIEDSIDVSNKETSAKETLLEEPITVDEIAGKFGRLFRRAAAEFRRAKKITRLLNSDFDFHSKSGRIQLSVRGGAVEPAGTVRAVSTSPLPWASLNLDDFDRMSILLSELAKVSGSDVSL